MDVYELINRLKGKCFSTCKTYEYFGTKLVKREYLGKIYKLTKYGAEWLQNGASTWW